MTDTAPAAPAARAIAGALIRHALGWAGIWLVRNGWLDQQTTDSAVSPIADYVLGATLAVGAAGWAVFRAWASHWRWVKAWTAPARPLSSDPKA